MRLRFLAASSAVLFAHALASAAPAPVLMTPTGPWKVEFANSMCLLSRPYGADRATELIFKPAMVGNSLEIVVTRATKTIGDVTSGEAKLSIGGQPSSAESYYTSYSTAKMRLLRISIKDDAIALAAVRGTVQIDAKSEGRHAFAIPGIERALPVLSTCLDQLRTAYKVSKADLAHIVTEAEGEKLPRIFSPNDYPDEALSKGLGGTVGALFWIEATGGVPTCEVVESSGVPDLDKTTCNVLIKRGKFTPAKDSAGRAVRAPSFVRIRWQIPRF